MKNLRKKNPALQALRQDLQAPAANWNQWPQTKQLGCAIQFLLIDSLEKKGSVNPSQVETVTPAATDVMLQATQLLQQSPQLFQTVRQLLEGTISLFLMPEGDDD